MGEVVRMKTDGLTSLVSGMNDPLRDKMATTYYGGQSLTDLELLNAYRFTWLGRKIVDIPAQDAVRKGRDWQADQKQIGIIEKEEKRLGFWGKLLEVQIKARLWGGAALFIGTGDVNLEEPLDIERIGKNGVKYLTVLNRRDMGAGEIDQDVTSEWFGKPSWYEVTGATSFLRIHPSRLCIFVGNAHPDPLLAGVTGWGDSALDSVYTAMKHSDATAANIASLVFEANVDIFKIPDFMSNLADPEYEARIIKRTTLAATMKGINRSLMMDAGEEYDRKQIAFTTLPEVMQTFLQMVSGAADIPVTRLLGQSPAGMNSTGESDMKNYHDRISSMQNMEITPAIHRLDECLLRSALGSRPDEIFYSWSPLEQMSEKQLAEIGKMNAETAKILIDTGIFTGEELRTVVTTQMVESSFYPGLDQVVAETGDIDFSEPKEGETDPADKTTKQTAANDAEPRTLYVRRDVVNAAEITAWAKAQGMTDIVPDLHVTIIYSRTPIDWIKAGNAREWADETNGGLTIPEGGPRVVEPLGNMAAVLMFASGQLYWRHKEILEVGAAHGFEDYQPHISLTKTAVDLSKVEPFRGKIVLGPEIFEEVKGE